MSKSILYVPITPGICYAYKKGKVDLDFQNLLALTVLAHGTNANGTSLLAIMTYHRFAHLQIHLLFILVCCRTTAKLGRTIKQEIIGQRKTSCNL